MVSKWDPGTEITAVEGYTPFEQISQRRQVVHDLKAFRDSLALGGSESFSPSCANLSSFPPLSNFRSRSSGWMLDVVIRGTVSSRS